MEYAVGQHVIHPAHGAGTVVDVTQEELIEGHKRYYVIRFANKRLTVHLPTQRTDEAGLRQVMSRTTFDEVLATLGKLPRPLPRDFKQRRQQLDEMIHSGEPVRVARAVRELSWRSEQKPLNKSDAQHLTMARTMLIEEMALVTGLRPEEINGRIDRELSKSISAMNKQLEEETSKA